MSREHIEIFNGPDMVAEFDVDYSTEKITNYHRYTDDWVISPFGNSDSVTYDMFLGFLESRCPERGRPDLKELLNKWGLEVYDPVGICKATRGLMWDDFLWIRFEGDDVTYDDIKIRSDFSASAQDIKFLS